MESEFADEDGFDDVVDDDNFAAEASSDIPDIVDEENEESEDKGFPAVAELVSMGSNSVDVADDFSDVDDLRMETDHRPVPRINIDVFCESTEFSNLMEAASKDRRLLKTHVTILSGGAKKAVEYFGTKNTPNLVILESIHGGKDLLEGLNALAEVCDPSTRVIVVGNKVVAAMMRVAEEGNFRANIHQGGKGQAINLSEKEKVIALQACKILGLEFAGVDILRSVNGPLVLEVNSSPGLEGIETTTKMPIAEEILKAATAFAKQ